MNLYPSFVERLKIAISESNARTVNEVWNVFKKIYAEILSNRDPVIAEIGIQAELDYGSELSPPCFYFALHYRIEYQEGSDEYSFYELAYCEFSLSSIELSDKIKGECKELWEYELTPEAVFREIEEWEPYEFLKNLTLQLTVIGTEV